MQDYNIQLLGAGNEVFINGFIVDKDLFTKYLIKEEVADFFQVTTKTVEKRCKEDLKFYILGPKLIRFKLVDLIQYMENQQI